MYIHNLYKKSFNNKVISIYIKRFQYIIIRSLGGNFTQNVKNPKINIYKQPWKNILTKHKQNPVCDINILSAQPIT